MSETTKGGLPKGRVPETLRKILGQDLSQLQADTFFVVFFSHAIVEESLNRILYTLMHYDLPLPPDSGIPYEDDPKVREMRSQLWTRISKMSFDSKIELLKPSLNTLYPKTVTGIKDINTLRGQMAHLRDFDKLQFRSKSLLDESTVEDVFFIAQQASSDLDHFWEFIDGNHAHYELWRDKLKELGEPLI